MRSACQCPLASCSSVRTAPAPRQVDVAFEEVDELQEEGSGGLSCVMGRASRPAQPQLVRARQLAEAAELYVALVDSSERVWPWWEGSLNEGRRQNRALAFSV